MSQVYEIKSVSGPKEWSGSHGPMHSYKLDLDNNGVLERQVEINRKPESRAPQVGELVAGDIQEGNYGPKFKLNFEETKALSNSSRPPSEASSAPKGGRDIDASIARQVALKVLSPRLARVESFTPQDRKYVEEIETFILEAGQGASRAQGSPPAQAAAAHPPGGSPGSGLPPADDAPQYLQKLLEDAFVDATGAHALALFIAETFDLEQRGAAENGLKDPDRQSEIVARLKTAYEQQTGRIVPVATDDSIPF